MNRNRGCLGFLFSPEVIGALPKVGLGMAETSTVLGCVIGAWIVSAICGILGIVILVATGEDGLISGASLLIAATAATILGFVAWGQTTPIKDTVAEVLADEPHPGPPMPQYIVGRPHAERAEEAPDRPAIEGEIVEETNV